MVLANSFPLDPYRGCERRVADIRESVSFDLDPEER